jgi:MFS family permease
VNPGTTQSQAVALPHLRHTGLLAAVESFWGFGMNAVSHTAVLPVLIVALDGTNTHAGLLAAGMALAFTAGQIGSGYLGAHLERKKRLVVLLHFVAPAPLALLSLYFGFAALGTRADLLPLLGLWAMFFAQLGLLFPVWIDFMGKVLEPSRRGRAFGGIFAANTLAGALGAALASRLLDSSMAFPRNYGLLFAIATAATVLGNLFFLPIRESRGPAERRQAGLGAYLVGLLELPRSDPNLAWLLLARACLGVSMLVLSFYAIHARLSLGVSLAQAALFGSVFLVTQAVSNPLMGALGDRFGHRLPVTLGGLSLAAAGLLAAGADKLWHFHLVAALGGVYFTTHLAASSNLVMALSPPARRTRYLTLSWIAVSPVTILAPLVGGRLMDTFGRPAVFQAAAVVLTLGALVVAFKVKERPPACDEECKRRAAE